MISTNCSSKTITVIKGNSISINCFADLNDGDTRFPDVYKSNLLDEITTIDNVDGIEGEVIVNIMDSNSDVKVEDGNLVLDLAEDDENKYSVDNNGDLIYNG